MTDMYLLSEEQMARISSFFPLSHGVLRVDTPRVISGIIFVIRNGLRWRDVPASYGPDKTIYNRLNLRVASRMLQRAADLKHAPRLH